MADRLLVRVEEAARLLSISRSKIYPELGRSIPVVRMGRSVRIPRVWLEDFVANRIAAWERSQSAGPEQ